MIFVTVGTHEQQFNRLVEYMDKYAETHLDEEVFIQTGFSSYVPKKASWRKLYPYKLMEGMVDRARVVITHGGPSSFIMPIQLGKIPIVVPRNHEFNEHVNNHQIDFCRKVAERQGGIIVVEDCNKLEAILDNYDSIVKEMQSGLESNNAKFCTKFGKIIEGLVRE